MMRKYPIVVIAVALALVAGACSKDKQEPATPATPPGTPQTQQPEQEQPPGEYEGEGDRWQQPGGEEGEPEEPGEQPPGALEPGQQGQAGADLCPAHVAGTTVSTEDTDKGIALVFTTDQSRQVDELRRRVRAMADMHNQHQGHAQPGVAMVPSQASVEDVDKGARITFEAQDQKRVAELRAQMRQHAAQMAAGQCAMMGQGK